MNKAYEKLLVFIDKKYMENGMNKVYENYWFDVSRMVQLYFWNLEARRHNKSVKTTPGLSLILICRADNTIRHYRFADTYVHPLISWL